MRLDPRTLAVAATLLASCAGDRRLEVIVCGDVSLPRAGSAYCDVLEDRGDAGPGGDEPEITLVAVEATSATGEAIYRASADMCLWDLPFTAVLREGYETVTLDVRAYGPAGPIHTSARPTFPATGVRELHVGLTRACLNVQCPAGRTCVRGFCEPVSDGWGSSICRGP